MPRDRADHRHIVGDADGGPEPSGPYRREAVGVDRFAEHDDVATVELRGDGIGHRDHRGREVSAQEALESPRGARLHDDLAGVPDVGDAQQDGRCPAVEGVERVGVHQVDRELAAEAGQPRDGERPPEHVARPGASPVTRREAGHGDDVQRGARRGELGREG